MPFKRILTYTLAIGALSVCSIQTFAQETRPRRVLNDSTEHVKPRGTVNAGSQTEFNALPESPKPRKARSSHADSKPAYDAGKSTKALNSRADFNYVAEDIKPRNRDSHLGTPRGVGEVPATSGYAPSMAKYHQLISAAINDRLGTPYQWAATGPDNFDCSGFVWDTFRSAGIDFQRASAATLWEQFEAPPPEQEYKFGTLVFFSGQTHVGIVADKRGFYHASKHKGVVYDEFNDYWNARIDGFRLAPLPSRPQRSSSREAIAAKR